MAAAGVAGYIAWLLWGTGIETRAAQNRPQAGVRAGRRDPNAREAPPPGVVPLRGSAYAELIIPRIDLDMIVVQGTDIESLKKGPGHYPDTAAPWDPTGRVGIAGHRTTYLAPFHDLDAMEVGDPITLRTEYGTFEYDVTEVFVIPADGSGIVLSQTVEPSLVLTTCHPQYSSRERLIVTASALSSGASRRRRGLTHSHSIVPGGFDVTSYATRFTPGTSATIRCAIRSRTSYGRRAQSAVIASSLVTRPDHDRVLVRAPVAHHADAPNVRQQDANACQVSRSRPARRISSRDDRGRRRAASRAARRSPHRGSAPRVPGPGNG